MDRESLNRVGEGGGLGRFSTLPADVPRTR
jgi:hypothetical protein